MPSPVGHVLGGLIAGELARPTLEVAPAQGGLLARSRHLVLFAALGVLPDLDFLVGRHSRESHSVGAVAVVVGVALWAAYGRASGPGRRPTSSAPVQWAVACGLAYASHILLDWLGSDTSPPIGIQALWPFTSAFYQSDAHFFYAVDRRFWLPGFLSHSALMLGWELAVLGPLAIGVSGLRLLYGRVLRSRQRRGAPI